MSARKLFATTRQFTGTPRIHRAYVYEDNHVVWTCEHNHRKAKTAQACANRHLTPKKRSTA